MADPTKAELQEALDSANARIGELEASLAGATGSAPGPDALPGIKSLLRLIPDAKRFQTGYLSVKDWKNVGVAADWLKGFLAPVEDLQANPEAPEASSDDPQAED